MNECVLKYNEKINLINSVSNEKELDKFEFIKGLNYIKCNFINWNFDLQNKTMLNVWYQKFKNLDTNSYMCIIQKYCEENQYPPNSPQQILSTLKISTKSAEEVLKWIYDLNNLYPFDNEYQRPKFYQELAKDSVAYKLFNDLKMWSLFEDIKEENKDKYNETNIKNTLYINHTAFIGFGKDYIEDKFICWYNHSKNPKTILKNNNNMISLNTNNNLQLE